MFPPIHSQRLSMTKAHNKRNNLSHGRSSTNILWAYLLNKGEAVICDWLIIFQTLCTFNSFKTTFFIQKRKIYHSVPAYIAYSPGTLRIYLHSLIFSLALSSAWNAVSRCIAQAHAFMLFRSLLQRCPRIHTWKTFHSQSNEHLRPAPTPRHLL